MVLDERSTLLLKEILLTPGMKISDLEKKLDVARYQVTYSLGKIDSWLSENKLPLLQRDRKTGIYVEQAVQELFPELIKGMSIYDVVFSDMERRKMIILMLLIRQEPYSLYHLSSALKVSRNTTLNDIREAGTFVESAKLEIVYTRKDGYCIKGNELEKRQIMIKLTHQLLQTSMGKRGMEDVLGVMKDEVQEMQQRLGKIEQRLKRQFTDEKLEELSYTLTFIARRIKQKKTLEIHYHDLLHTEEYQVLKEIFTFDEKELLFIALQLFTSNISSQKEQEEKECPYLTAGILKVIDNFERMSCVDLQEKEELAKHLYWHLKPALYRMKYQLVFDNPLLESVRKEYSKLHYLVKKAVAPLEEIFKVEIPEHECGYLTMLFGSELLNQGDEIARAKIAIVVCSSGISVSKLLYETLKKLFPEMVFLDYISLRNFSDYPHEYDLIFSTTFLRTNKKLFLVKPFLTNDEKYHLKARVYQEISGYSSSNVYKCAHKNM